MRLITIALIFGLVLLTGCNRPAGVVDTTKESPGVTPEQYRKELEDIKKGIRSETKIKLKKDGKGTYSWEIQGKDPNEVLKVNDTLRKKLGE